MAYPIAKLIIPSIYMPWIRKVEGIENIPNDKPFIIAANHSSYFDIFLPAVVIIPRIDTKIHPLVNSHYWKSFITKAFLDMWEAIPVYTGRDKDSKGKNKKAIETAANYLKSGRIVMIFPEGTRSQTGTLQRAKTGVARLALKSKVPVLPFGIIDAHKVLPKGKAFPRFAKCEVKIGKLISFEKYYSKKINEKILNEATREIMKQIAKLINQKYNY